MLHIATREADGLRQCLRELRSVLASLDDHGAGIAAIHVNAAIEQLKWNLAVIKADQSSSGRSTLFFEDENG